jgi:predicted nucleotidyltransferase
MLGRRRDAMTEVIEARRTALEDLCQRYGVARLALFGSALRDDFEPDTSDLNLVVEFSSMSPSTPQRTSSFSRTLRIYSRAGWTSWRSAPSETPTCAGRSKSTKKRCQAGSAAR